MGVVGAVLGAIVGILAGHNFSWFLFGGVVGFLAADLIKLNSRVATLERELQNRGQEPYARIADAPTTTTAETGEQEPLPSVPPVPAPALTPEILTPITAASIATEPALTAAAPPEVLSEPTPNIFDIALREINRFFTGGNTLVRVGVVILFFGVAFLLKYAAEHARLPIELRLAAVTLGAIALLGVGVRLRSTREAYGLTLEGGAIGTLYLVVFAALRLYDLVPPPLAFGLLVVICGLSAVLALAQNSHALAILGAAGGFLAPVLTSTGHGSHVMLFSYYAVLGVGIFAIAWFKAWRALNVVGFGFTFVIGATWGYRYYQPEFFATTEPFLIFFFLLYVAVTLLFARRQPPELRSPVDGTLVFGVPIVGFLLQAALVKDIEYGVAGSALVLAAFYLGLAALILHRGGARLLAEAFVALGTIFATLTIPLAVDGYWTAAAWAVEGAGVLWIGLRQSRLLPRAFGLLVQFGAGVFFLNEVTRTSGMTVLNSGYVGAMLVSVAGIMSAYLMFRFRERITSVEQDLGLAMLLWGLAWWYGGNGNEIQRHVMLDYRESVALLVIAATAFSQEFIGRRFDWLELRYASAFNLAFLFLILIWAAIFLAHPFEGFGFIAWPIALGVHYAVLKTHETAQPGIAMEVRHAGALWLVVALLGLEMNWALGEVLPHSDWPMAAIGLWFALVLMALTNFKDRYWPVKGNEQAYLVIGAVPLVVLAFVWIFTEGVGRAGAPAPLPFLPLLNPLDVAAMFVLVAIGQWVAVASRLTGWSTQPLWIALGATAFVWVNAVLFRALHHFAGIPYAPDAMFASTLAQSAVSIFWTILAFGLMLIATRIQTRLLWLTGSALLGVVVVKLFAVDLSSTGTVARIVSFVGVGLLLLLIGYFVPVPPKSENGAEAQS